MIMSQKDYYRNKVITQTKLWYD